MKFTTEVDVHRKRGPVRQGMMRVNVNGNVVSFELWEVVDDKSKSLPTVSFSQKEAKGLIEYLAMQGIRIEPQEMVK